MGSFSDFNYAKISEKYVLLTNYAGRHVCLTNDEFQEFIHNKPLATSIDALKNNYFYSEKDLEEFRQEYSLAVRDYRDYLFSGTSLHIFVLTSKCNLKCVYCQASTCNNGENMSTLTAEKCVDLALQSPSNNLSFEFQGGEPLENFEVLKHIVLYTEKNKKDKNITYNLVSNLTLINDEIIDFLNMYRVSVSTSLDGSETVHNANRPLPSGNSYYIWKEKYDSLRKNYRFSIGAIQTTTKQALNKSKELIDEYLSCGFKKIFIRPLTPLGYAAKRWEKIGYNASEFVEFYKECLNYIIQRNIDGYNISEGHASIFLEKIVNHKAGNYTELRSPCGAAFGQLAYNYDGKIYTCDEGRMLAEMGDDTFQVGTVDSVYNELFDNPTCKAVATASCLESIPHCSDCVYSPYCGVCPVLNYYENNNIFSISPYGFKCEIYRGILDFLFEKIYFGTDEEKAVLFSWCRNYEC